MRTRKASNAKAILPVNAHDNTVDAMPPACSINHASGLHSLSSRSFPFGFRLSAGYMNIPPHRIVLQSTTPLLTVSTILDRQGHHSVASSFGQRQPSHNFLYHNVSATFKFDVHRTPYGWKRSLFLRDRTNPKRALPPVDVRHHAADISGRIRSILGLGPSAVQTQD